MLRYLSVITQTIIPNQQLIINCELQLRQAHRYIAEYTSS